MRVRSGSEDRGVVGFMETGKVNSLNQRTKGQALTTPFFLGLEMVTVTDLCLEPMACAFFFFFF
jgi:hypothetical protein